MSVFTDWVRDQSAYRLLHHYNLPRTSQLWKLLQHSDHNPELRRTIKKAHKAWRLARQAESAPRDPNTASNPDSLSS
jgi:hypothetical protein